jgi:2-succinyl-5-enolpyruvyl-6-hydroxy-3-cyclohexene-1-carboxylate synthase
MANRGANGIDGTVSTFLGALAGGAGRGLLLIGDQAMQHDLGGLEATKLAGLHGTICVVNNSGSSLLSLFGLAGVPEHGRLVRNPPALRLEGAAAAFGLPFRRCDGADALRDALAEGAVRPGVRLVEAVVPPGALAGDLQRLLRAAVPAEAV